MMRLRWPWKRRTMGVRVELEQTKQLPLLGERGGMVRRRREPVDDTVGGLRMTGLARELILRDLEAQEPKA